MKIVDFTVCSLGHKQIVKRLQMGFIDLKSTVWAPFHTMLFGLFLKITLMDVVLYKAIKMRSDKYTAFVLRVTKIA